MKKSMLVLSSLFWLVSQAKADSVNVGQTSIPAYSTNANQSAAMTYGTDRSGNWNMLGVDGSGNAAVSFGGGTGTAGTWVRLTATAYAGVTTNAATTLGITATAGSSNYTAYLVLLSVDAGATAVRGLIHNSATPPTTLSANNGPIYYQGDNQSVIGFTPVDKNTGVWYISMFATALSGATSGTVFIQIFGR